MAKNLPDKNLKTKAKTRFFQARVYNKAWAEEAEINKQQRGFPEKA